MEGFEQFIGFNPWTALFTLINLIITFLLLKKFLFKPVKKMIDDRQQEIDGLYADADAKIAEAEALRSDYAAKIDSAKEESAEILRSAKHSARQQSDEIVRAAKNEASAIKQKAMDDIALERKKALNEVKDDISGIAMEIAEKVVEKELGPDDQSALIDAFIEKMGDAQ